jgi:molybdopterin/thiamine biosynthesis adenylyltransferase
MNYTHDEKQFYKEAFARNKGLISDQLQKKLQATHVAICGMGGVGEIHAETLARLGVGSFTIADGDVFERVNSNRQLEAMTSTLGKQKEEVIAKTLLDINPFAKITRIGYITPDNLNEFFNDASIIIDGMDFFEFDIRRMIFNEARTRGIPVITAAPVGFGSSVIVFTKDSMSFDDYFAVDDNTEDLHKPILFGLGLTPSLLQRKYFAPQKLDVTKKQAPSSVLGTLAAADWAGTLVCKLVDNQSLEVAPVSYHFDPYVTRMKRTNLRFGNRGLLQRLKFWYVTKFLLKKSR